MPWLSWAGWALAAAALARLLFHRGERRALAVASSALGALALASLLLFVAAENLGLRLTGPAHLGAFGLVAALALAVSRVRREADAPPPAGGPVTPLELALFLAFAFAFAQSSAAKLFAPFDDWDAYTYHLALAREISQGAFGTGFGRSFIGQYEAAFPPLPFHLYALVLAPLPESAWPAALKVLLTALHALFCAYVWGLARHRLGLSRAAALAALLVVGLRLPAADDQPFQEPVLSSLAALYLLAALYHGWSVFFSEGAERRASLALVTVLAFGVYWSTYAGFVLLPVVLGAAVAARVLAREPSTRGWATLAVGLGALALMLPHLARNLVELGNPLYPALWGALGGRDVTDWFLSNRAAIARPVRPPLSQWHVVLQAGAPVAHLVLAALGALAVSKPGALARRSFWALALGGFLAVWMVAFQFEETPTWRYLFPLWPLAALAIAASLAGAGPRARLAWALFFAVLLALYQLRAEALPPVAFWGALAAGAALLGWGAREVSLDLNTQPRESPSGGVFPLAAVGVAAWLLFTFPGGLRSLAGVQTVGALLLLVAAVALRARLAALSRRGLAAAGLLSTALLLALPFDANRLAARWEHPVVAKDLTWLNEHLQPSDKVLLFEARTFGLTVPFLPADALGAEPFLRASSTDAALDALRAAGVTHLYSSGTYAWPQLDLRLSELLADGQAVEVLYRRDEAWVARLK